MPPEPGDRQWFRQDVAELAEDWLNEDMPPAQRWAYICLKGYIKAERPSQKRHSRAPRLSVKAAARRWNVSTEHVEAMLVAVTDAGKLRVEGDDWVLSDLTVCASEDTVRRSEEAQRFAAQIDANDRKPPQTPAPCINTGTGTGTGTGTNPDDVLPVDGFWGETARHPDLALRSLAEAAYAVPKFRANVPSKILAVENVLATVRAWAPSEGSLLLTIDDFGQFFAAQAEIKVKGYWWETFRRWCQKCRDEARWQVPKGEIKIPGREPTEEETRERNRQRSLAMQGDGRRPERNALQELDEQIAREREAGP